MIFSLDPKRHRRRERHCRRTGDGEAVGFLFPLQLAVMPEQLHRFDRVAEMFCIRAERLDFQLRSRRGHGQAKRVERAVFTDGETKVLRTELEVRVVASELSSRKHLQLAILQFPLAGNRPREGELENGKLKML